MLLVLALACGASRSPVAAGAPSAGGEEGAPVPAGAPASDPPRVRVEAGVYRLGEREVWVGGFAIDATAGPEDACSAVPGADERRIAAKDPAFVTSSAFEALAHAPGDACEVQQAVVEAEGIEGWAWFGGWGGRLGGAEVLGGEGDPREGVIRVHNVSFYFFGEEYKPAPRMSRCIERDPASWTRAWTTAPVEVRAARGGEVVHAVPAGTELRVWHRDGAWAWVEAPRYVEDDSGDETVLRTCAVPGWVATEALRSSDP